VEAEAIVGERVADPRGRGLAALLAALRLAGILEERNLVPPILLRPVHRLVSGKQDRLGADLALTAEHRDPDADRRALGVGRGHRALRDLGAQILAQLQGARGVGLRHQDGELVAGEPGDDVGGAHPLPHDRGDQANQVVAGVVTVRIVDGLEAVDVDDHHRALAAVAGAEGDVLVQLGAEATAVEQPRERVVIGDVAKLRLGLLGLRQGLGDDLAILWVEFGQHRFDRRIALGWERFFGHLVTVELSAPKRIADHAHVPKIRPSIGYPEPPKVGVQESTG
jgi:hypothetical protein